MPRWGRKQRETKYVEILPMSAEIATAQESLITFNLFRWGETNQPIAQIERYEWMLCIYSFLPHRFRFKQQKCAFNTTFIYIWHSDWNTRDEKTLSTWLQPSSAICPSSVAFTISTSQQCRAAERKQIYTNQRLRFVISVKLRPQARSLQQEPVRCRAKSFISYWLLRH